MHSSEELISDCWLCVQLNNIVAINSCIEVRGSLVLYTSLPCASTRCGPICCPQARASQLMTPMWLFIVQIDITGQVVSDSIGTKVYSGVGGQVCPSHHTCHTGSRSPSTHIDPCVSWVLISRRHRAVPASFSVSRWADETFLLVSMVGGLPTWCVASPQWQVDPRHALPHQKGHPQVCALTNSPSL